MPLTAAIGQAVTAAGAAATHPAAVLVGGYFGQFLPWTQAARQPLGESRLGAGVLQVLAAQVCWVSVTASILSYLAGQSAGQCGPCLHGLDAVAGTLTRLRDRQAGPGDLQRLHRWTTEIPGRGACRHPDGAVGLLGSALTTFTGDFDQHAASRDCQAAS